MLHPSAIKDQAC